MLKCTRLPTEAFGCGWYINAITGSLVKTLDSTEDYQSLSTPSKVQEALNFCREPFLLKSPNSVRSSEISSISTQQLQSVQKKLLFLSDKWLFLSIFYASQLDITFENSADAFTTIQRVYGQETGVNCLQKTLHVAKTSKSFQKNGVLFIGANLPTGHMHSWIIEGDIQPDNSDSLWVSYRPMLAFSY